MKRSGTLPYIAAAMVILWIAGTLMSSRTASAAPGGTPGSQVTITGPFPVPIAGAAVVSGTVSAQQTGPWNVAVSNFPVVKIDSGAPVTLPNSATPGMNAVQVRDVNHAMQSVNAACNFNFSVGVAAGTCPSPIYNVPPGKELVVEYLEAHCSVDAGETIAAELNTGSTSAPGVRTGASAPASGVLPFAGVGQNVIAYFPAGTPIDAVVFATAAPVNQPRCKVSFWGHLVDVV